MRRVSGFYKGVPKVRYVDAGRPVPTPKYRTDWNVFRNLRLTLRDTLAASSASSQDAQLTRPLTYQSCLGSGSTKSPARSQRPSGCQTANDEIECYVHTYAGPYIKPASSAGLPIRPRLRGAFGIRHRMRMRACVFIPWVASWRAKHGSCGTCRNSRKARNGRGMGMLCAARKAAESRGKPRKAAEGSGARRA